MIKPQSLLCPRPEGLYCPPGDFYIDPVRPVARAVITHGHADHARAGHGTVLATPETLAIMAARYGEDFTATRQSAAYGEVVSRGTLAPLGLGCIDHSVSHRLRQKLRALQILLDDPDLHEIAYDEENSEDPIAWDISPDDVRDLIEVLEGRAQFSDEESE